MTSSKNKRKSTLIKILIFCILTTIISIDLTLARYKSETQLQATTTVALMANDTTIEIENNLEGYPGCEPIVCPITINNQKDSKICNVSQKYEIYIDRTNIENIPLEFSLYTDEYCTEILAPDENGVYSDDTFVLKAGIAQSATYYLKVEWPESENSSDLAFEVEYFKINIDIDQID